MGASVCVCSRVCGCPYAAHSSLVERADGMAPSHTYSRRRCGLRSLCLIERYTGSSRAALAAGALSTVLTRPQAQARSI